MIEGGPPAALFLMLGERVRGVMAQAGELLCNDKWNGKT
jgi:hypothetical protein